MIHDKYFVITSATPWREYDCGDAQHIAVELARYNKVLYVNPPQNMIQLMKGSVDKEFRSRISGNPDKAIRRENHSLWVLEPPVITAPVSLARNGLVSDALVKRNNKKLSKAVFWAMSILEFGDAIHINDNDPFGGLYMKELLMPELSVYYVSAGGRGGVTGTVATRLNDALVRKSDIVVTTDTDIKDMENINANVFNIGRGLDFSDIYIDNTIRYRFSAVKRPIVGYAGKLDAMHLCPDCLYSIAKARAGYSFVLVGKEDVVFRNHMLCELPNVIFINDDREEKEASYETVFDVCLYPIAVTEANVNSEHFKVFECLYLGKPVVTMNIAPLNPLGEYVSLANNDVDFLDLLDKAVAEPEGAAIKAHRKDYAESQSWPSCVGRICDAIESVLKDFYSGREVEMYIDRNNVS